MIPYGKQSVNKKDIDNVVSVLQSEFLTTGPAVAQFEKLLAQYTKTRYAVAVCNGTAALHLAYLAAGLGKGDEVITTPNTFVATTNMLLAVGAIPVFCDINLETYNIDERSIERSITKRTKAIVPVHFGGNPVAMNTIKRIAKKYHLLVIEDAAHALGARYGKKPIGGISDMTTFSFHPVKSITTGEGGAIVTNNKKFYDRLRLLRTHGVHKDSRGFNVMTELGYNYRITDIQCALGISQMKRLPEFIRARRKKVTQYQNLLSKVPEIILPTEAKGSTSSWHIYVIRTAQPGDQMPLYRHLLAHGIGANFHYPAVYSHPYYRKHGFRSTRFPNTNRYNNTAITIPLYPELTTGNINYIAGTIKKFFKKNEKN